MQFSQTDQWGRHRSMSSVATVDWVCLLLYGGLTWCIVQHGLALLDRVLLLRKIHLEFFVTFSPGRTLKQCRTHQSWSMFRRLALSGSGRFLPWVHGDLADLDKRQDLTELIFWWWHGCALEGIEDAWVSCGEDHMWSRRVLITFWGVCNHVARPSMVLASQRCNA